MVPPCVRAKSPQLCPTLCDPWTVSPVHVILQTRILEWVVVRSSRRSSQPRYQTHISWVSCIGKRIRYHYCHLVTQSCPTLRDAMDCSTPGFPVLHHLPEFVQTHVHQVGDTIQQSYSLSSPSPAFNLSQHQGLFKWVSYLHQVAKVLELQLQHHSFQWIFKVDFL